MNSKFSLHKMDNINSAYTHFNYKVFNKCPICLNEDIKRKGRKGTGDKETHPQVFNCNNCGVFFVNPIIDSKSLYKMYKNFDISYGSHEEKVLEKIKRNAKYWDTLFHDEKDRKEKLKFLDIGSASGEFVNAFCENGWDSYGIEPCKALVDYSKKQSGLINIQHTTVEEANYPENYFDFIHFWHVLEHVIEPRRVLYKIHYWLKPGGILNLGTPSPDSLVTKFYPKITGYFDLGSVHTFIFPRQSLNTLLKTIGFEIKEHTVYSTLRTGNNFKAKIHNFLHHIYPKAVQNFQRVKAYKSSGI